MSRPMAAVGVIGLATAAPYALDQIQVQVAVDLAANPHSAGDREHWDEIATTALVLPLLALVAALRARGWRRVDRRGRHGGLRRCLGPDARAGIEPWYLLGHSSTDRRDPVHRRRDIEARRKAPWKDIPETPSEAS